MPGAPVYRSKNAQYAVSNFLRHPAYLSLSTSTSPHLIFPYSPLPQSAWETYTLSEMERVDAGSIAPRTLLANLGYLRVIHVDNWGIDPYFFKSPLYQLANGSSLREKGINDKENKPPREKKVDTVGKGLNSKGLKHLVRFALSREWISDSTQWESMFPLSQSQVSTYIRSVFNYFQLNLHRSLAAV
jgi:hypothetical protein